MRAVDIIAKKRDGLELTAEEIDFFVQGFTRGDIPDYQAAAWAMAVLLRGMTARETIDLTMSMVRSGKTLDLSGVAPFVVDKHSTGGVGDKTTLVVAPMVAALGLLVGKMSGRGLGFSGGTLDKLESIPGLRVDLSAEEFAAVLAEHGIVVTGQTADLAPADGKLYALRDVSGTVPSLPLIASSIMSKKIASGANAIVLDVKVGSGAFMKTLEDAIALSHMMLQIGQGLGRRVVAVISDMNQPLGRAIGNALEVREAVNTLRGEGPDDFVEHCLVVASHMLILGGRCRTIEEARSLLQETIRTRRALGKFKEMVMAQGGDGRVVDDPMLLPAAQLVKPLLSPRAGYVAALDAEQVGRASVILGAGREKKGDPVDHAVGAVLNKKIGEYAREDEPLLWVHANAKDKLDEACERLLDAFKWSNNPVQPPPLIYEVIDSLQSKYLFTAELAENAEGQESHAPPGECHPSRP